MFLNVPFIVLVLGAELVNQFHTFIRILKEILNSINALVINFLIFIIIGFSVIINRLYADG